MLFSEYCLKVYQVNGLKSMRVNFRRDNLNEVYSNLLIEMNN